VKIFGNYNLVKLLNKVKIYLIKIDFNLFYLNIIKLIHIKMNESSIVSYEDIKNNYDPKNNISVPFLTIYEKTSILGLRKQQLTNGAKTYLEDKLIENSDIEKIAILELEHKKLPFIICRTFPNGLQEYFKLDDLMILN
jgi:DNA-directed RNA polymerase subunit K/omega